MNATNSNSSLIENAGDSANISNFEQYLARESIMWSTWIFVVINSDVPITCTQNIISMFTLNDRAYQYLSIDKFWKVGIPQSISDMSHPRQSQPLQLCTIPVTQHAILLS